MNRNLCVASTFLSAHEGLRSRETTVTYDGGRRKASYAERDLRRNATVGAFQTEIPACTQEITGALYRLRGMRLAVDLCLRLVFQAAERLCRRLSLY